MKSDKSNLTVRYADGRDTDALYKLWKECFHDTDAFMAYYFDYYLRDNRILILEQKNQLKSMIHLNPYTLSVCGKKVNSLYVVGVATDADFRHCGAMTRLLQRTFSDCYAGRIPLIYLMPANEAIYTPFQFAYIYSQYVEKKTHTPFSSIHNVDAAIVRDISAHPVSSEAERQQLADWSNSLLSRHYDVFTRRDAYYFERLQMENQADGGDLLLLSANGKQIGYVSYACEEIMEIREIYCEPEWQSAVGQWVLQAFRDKEGELLPLVQAPFIADAADVRGMKRPIIMGRIIDAAEWIKCMPIRNISLDIAISIIDRWIPENESTWYWQISPEGNSFERTEGPWDICLDIDTFLQWLSGYIPADELIRQHRILLRTDWQENDAMHTLEQIPVLHGLMINEIV